MSAQEERERQVREVRTEEERTEQVRGVKAQGGQECEVMTQEGQEGDTNSVHQKRATCRTDT